MLRLFSAHHTSAFDFGAFQHSSPWDTSQSK